MLGLSRSFASVVPQPNRPWAYVEDLLAYPGWLEVLAGIGGGIGYTLVTFFLAVQLSDRPGLETATALLPDFWQVAGIVLASWHA